MPIKSVFKKAQQGGVSLPVIAKLHKGAPKEKNKPGKELPHWRLNWEQKTPYTPDEVAIVREAFERRFSANPDTIDGIAFHVDLIESVFDNHFEQWNKNRCIARCDGENMSVHMAGGKLTYGTHKCMCDPHNRACKPSGRLFFRIPAIDAETGILCLYQAQTTSIVDAQNITANLLETMSVIGALRAFPNGDPLVFTLYRTKQQIKGFDRYPIHLSWGTRAAQLIAQQQLALTDGNLALPAPEDEYEIYEVILEPRMKVSIEGNVKTFTFQTLDRSARYSTSNPDILHFMPFVVDYEPGVYEGAKMPELPIIAQVSGNEILHAELEEIAI